MSTIIRKQTELNEDQLEALKEWAKNRTHSDFKHQKNAIERIELMRNIELYGESEYKKVIRYGEVFICELDSKPLCISIVLQKSPKKLQLVCVLAKIDFHFLGFYAVPNLLPF